MQSMAKEISIVIPCYNCEQSIEELHSRLVSTLTKINKPFEIIYVNDASDDKTLTFLRTISDKNSNVIVINFMFNSGQFKAIFCGLEHSCGNFVITLDDDLQHPPEEIHKLYNHMKNNKDLDVVFGSYIEKKHSIIRNLGSYIVEIINEKIFNKPKNIIISSFRCLNRKVVDSLIMHKTQLPLISPIILKVTKNIDNIIVEHHNRKHGNSNYNFYKLVKFTIDNVVNFSTKPLKYITILGLLISFLSFLFIIYNLCTYFFGEGTVPGWMSIIILINFYSGVILLSVGIIGEYIGRIVQEVNGHPRYIISDIYGEINKTGL